MRRQGGAGWAWLKVKGFAASFPSCLFPPTAESDVMDSRRKSLRESLRMEGRDYSLIAVAAMFVIFGLAFSNAIIPNYHEQQALEKRRAELRQLVKATTAANAAIEDEIEALDDPYYMAQKMVQEFKYTYAPPVVDKPKNEPRGN
jgi:hypothetical protein